MKLDEIDIHELLPQQEPFVMVDQLTAFDEKITATSLTVRADNIFVEDGWLNECALAENIAQTCAARLGYINKYILKRAIQIGFIGAIRDMTVVARPHVGDRLETVIEVMEQVMELTLVKATITCNGRQIASAQMKIALGDEVIA
mgnify:CR=1 FL=1